MTIESTIGQDIDFSSPIGRTYYTENEVTASRERYAGKYLGNEEVIEFIQNTDPDTVDAVVLWSGSALADDDIPMLRFSKIVEEEFGKLPNEKKSDFLAHAARYVLLDFNQSYMPQQKTNRKPHPKSILIRQNQQKPYADNMSALFREALNYTNNDVEKAHNVLIQNLSGDIRKERSSIFLALSRVYSPEKTDKPTHDSDSKVAELAFLIAVEMGDFVTSAGSFIDLMEKVFLESHVNIRIPILRFVNRELKNRRVAGVAFREVALLKDKIKNDPQIYSGEVAFEVALMDDYMEIGDLLKKVKNGGIVGKEAFNRLVSDINLLDLMAIEGLEELLSAANDERIIAHLEKCIDEKRRS